MSDFAVSYAISRGRFEESLAGIGQEGLNYRLHEGAATIGEMALHVAGVEVSFISQLSGCELDEFSHRLKAASTDGIVNELPFPFAPSEISPELVSKALAIGRGLVEPHINALTPELRQMELKSALGPMITGEGAFARLAFHPGYHQGQVYLIATSPNFPR